MKPVKGQPELQMARKRAGVTQRELADVLGCDPSRVSQFETEGRLLPFRKGADEYLDALAIASAVIPTPHFNAQEPSR